MRSGIVLVLYVCSLSMTALAQVNPAAPPPVPAAAPGGLPGGVLPGQSPPPLAMPGLAAGYKSEILQGFYEEYVFKLDDRRDPFSPYSPKVNFSPVPITHPLQRFDLASLRVIGIIWNNTSPKALILDPQNNSYVVVENDRIGNTNGYVAKIREGEIVIVEEHMDVTGNKAYLTKLMPFQKQ